jgi:hypothetical protein
MKTTRRETIQASSATLAAARQVQATIHLFPNAHRLGPMRL